MTSRVKWNVDRSSQADKLRDFLHWMSALKKSAIYQVKQKQLSCNRVLYYQSISLGETTKTCTVEVLAQRRVSWTTYLPIVTIRILIECRRHRYLFLLLLTLVLNLYAIVGLSVLTIPTSL